MKKHFIRVGFLLLLFMVFSACSSLKQKPKPNSLEYYLSDFEKAVLKHDAERVLELMDEEYVKNQHDNFLSGNTTQFLNEFFCGNLIDGSGFKCPKFTEIKSLKRTRLIEEHEGFRVVYEVSTKKIKVETDWVITVKQFSGQKIFGLYGASG
ncbi:MAG: hypothetical protein ACOCWC_03250 [Bacteroidota bacterium]